VKSCFLELPHGGALVLEIYLAHLFATGLALPHIRNVDELQGLLLGELWKSLLGTRRRQQILPHDLARFIRRMGRASQCCEQQGQDVQNAKLNLPLHCEPRCQMRTVMPSASE